MNSQLQNISDEQLEREYQGRQLIKKTKHLRKLTHPESIKGYQLANRELTVKYFYWDGVTDLYGSILHYNVQRSNELLEGVKARVLDYFELELTEEGQKHWDTITIDNLPRRTHRGGYVNGTYNKDVIVQVSNDPKSLGIKMFKDR